MIKVNTIFHREKPCIALSFAYNAAMIRKIKQITDIKWSKTLSAWYFPHSAAHYNMLTALFPDMKFPAYESLGEKQEVLAPVSEAINQDNSKLAAAPKKASLITIEVFDRKIILKLAKNSKDIAFINTIKYSRWNGKTYCWEIPNYPGTLSG